MDIESVFLRAMFQATDNWILRGGPEPNDKAILSLAPELAGFIAAANEPEDDEEDGMEWIPVSERLPDLEDENGESPNVLGYYPDYPPDIQLVWYTGNGWEDGDGSGRDVKAPSHWMPLPAPPTDAK